MREAIATIILFLLMLLCIQFAAQSFQVDGASMRPALAPGDYLLVNKLAYRRIAVDGYAGGDPPRAISVNLFPFHAPARGEIVVFKSPHYPRRDFVKRVIGAPGDTVEIRAGRVFINGERLDEPYIERPDSDDMAELEVPDGSFFVMGDNRRDSNDSRDWGAVPLENIIGMAWAHYWPLEDIRLFPSAEVQAAQAQSKRMNWLIINRILTAQPYLGA